MQVDKQFIAMMGLILNQEGKILLIKESESYKDGAEDTLDKRGLPGGRLYIGEKREDGLLREIKEECGLSVSIHRPFHVDERHPNIRGEQRQIVGVFFLCETHDSNVTLSDDHKEFKRINPQDHKSYSLINPVDDVIESYLQSR